MDEFYILSRQGGIAKHFDLRLAGLRMLVVYADYIESPLARMWKAAQVLPCHRRHPATLVPVHSGFPRLHVPGRSRLDFHEAKNIFFPSDQVNLSPASRRPEVPRHHRVAQLPQMKVGGFFSPPPSLMMRSNPLGRQRLLRHPVQEPK
jgi:hypothetical protein